MNAALNFRLNFLAKTAIPIFNSGHSFIASIMSCIRNLFLRSPIWTSLCDYRIRLARIFRLRCCGINIPLMLALFYFLFVPNFLRPNADITLPQAMKKINKTLFSENYYVIFSVYTYHSAIRFAYLSLKKKKFEKTMS